MSRPTSGNAAGEQRALPGDSECRVLRAHVRASGHHSTVTRTDRLTRDQLAEVARKALDNSVALIDEADGLISFGRFARGYALAILAGEEFGKFMMCQGTVGALPGDEEYWRTFWKRFTDHDAKAANFTSMVGQFVEDDDERRWFMDNIERHVDADQARKFGGLYVDVTAEGIVEAPEEVVDPDAAHAVAYVLGTFIRGHASLWDGVDFHEMYASAQDYARHMMDALSTNDPDTIIATWHRTLGRSDSVGDESG